MSPTANPVTSSSGSASTNPATSAATAVATDPLASESTFLTLLVSQLQNQDPLNPTDSTQFVSQLTSYSQLEQLINIDKNTTPAAADTTSTSSANSTTGV
ncbi:MAG TPA: flagellar hook capping FlgD N-terminal domain-containing protein [Bryobacteraceae bacterium]|jgi:flagellar basal-body rod modification protein FlgD